MRFNLKKRDFVRIVSFTSALVLTLGIFTFSFYRKSEQYHSSLENGYASALSDLTDHLSCIDETLQKQIYANTATQLSTLASTLFKESGGAKSALSHLPIEQADANAIYRFLSQVGNYSLSLASKAAAEQKITQSDRETLQSLSNYASSLSNTIGDLNATLDGDGIWDGEIEYAISGLKSSEISQIAAAAESITQTVSSYPTLIYDGPYSDHIDRKTPMYTMDKLNVSQDTARQNASKFLMCDLNNVEYIGDESSITPAYIFECDECICAVTKSGGALLYITCAREAQSSKFTEEQAIAAARNYLKTAYSGNFTESYYVTANGICTVNFAYTQDGVICYPDLVKVAVALDDCKVVEVEARGFIMNHYNREITSKKHSADQAKAVLSEALTVRKTATCIVNPDTAGEVLCYEFSCVTDDGKEILVYVNCDTLEEEDILLIERTDGGVLTR